MPNRSNNPVLSEKAQASLNVIVSKFQAGDLSPITRAVQFSLPEDAPAKNWSWRNRVLAAGQREDGCVDCRTYKAWEQAGRTVKPGSRAVWIYQPHFKKVEDEKTGEIEMIRTGFGWSHRIAATDTEGDQPLPNYTPAKLPPLSDLAGRLGIEVNWLPGSGRAFGTCQVDGSIINMHTDSDAVWFHELSHAIMAFIYGNNQGGQIARQEIAVEFASCVLMHLYLGQDNTGNAWQYIKSYNPTNPLMAVTAALQTVQDILNFIYNQEEGEEAE